MMILSVATGIGLQQKIRQKVSAFNGHVIISSFNDNQSDVSVAPISLKQQFYPKFNGVEGISHIQGVATLHGMIRTETAFEGILFKGVGRDYDWKNIDEYIVEGRKPNLTGALNNEVIISQYLANRLNLKMGDAFNTFFIKEETNKIPKSRRFQIVGIFNSGFQEFDATYVLGDLRHIQRINKWRPDEVGSFEVFIEDFSKIKEKSEEIYNQTGSLLNTQSITDKYYYIFDWLQLFDFNILVILIIMIVVATINMVVALLVLILERTQMIGILKAQGANNWMIRKIFLYNAAHLIVRGIFWGNLIGIGMIAIQHYFGIVQLNPESYYVTTAPVYFNIGYILALNALTIFICLLVLLIPSYIITRISPAKTIRFD